MKAEVLDNGVGCLGTLVKDTAGATHALTCGVLDRESNETKYTHRSVRHDQRLAIPLLSTTLRESRQPGNHKSHPSGEAAMIQVGWVDTTIKKSKNSREKKL